MINTSTDIPTLTASMMKLAKAMVQNRGCRPVGFIFSSLQDNPIMVQQLDFKTEEIRQESLARFRDTMKSSGAYAGILLFESYFNMQDLYEDSKVDPYGYGLLEPDTLVAIGASPLEYCILEQQFYRNDDTVEFVGEPARVNVGIEQSIFHDIWKLHRA